MKKLYKEMAQKEIQEYARICVYEVLARFEVKDWPLAWDFLTQLKAAELLTGAVLHMPLENALHEVSGAFSQVLWMYSE